MDSDNSVNKYKLSFYNPLCLLKVHAFRPISTGDILKENEIQITGVMFKLKKIYLSLVN